MLKNFSNIEAAIIKTQYYHQTRVDEADYALTRKLTASEKFFKRSNDKGNSQVQDEYQSLISSWTQQYLT